VNRRILLATTMVAGFAGCAGTAFAQTNVYGGGSTLAENLYNRTVQAIAANGIGSTALDFGINYAGSVGEFWYAPGGSGKGQQSFLTQINAFAAGQLPASVSAIHYGASDAYLSADQIAYWNTGVPGASGTPSASYPTLSVAPASVGGPLIQLPTFATAIVIAHTNFSYTKAITLTDNDICGIFSGKITDWSGIQAIPGKTTAPKGLGGPLTVQYREDGSGTSFLFTQHLQQVCNSSNTAAGVTFTATKYFADIFGAPLVSGSNHFVNPTNWQGAVTPVAGSGSGAVANNLIAGTNNIAYITPDYTSIAPSGLVHYAAVAAANGTSITSAVDPLLSPYQYIKYAKVYNTASGKAYAPNPGGATKAFSNPNGTNGTINPATGALTVGSNDYSPGYPATKSAANTPSLWIPAVGNPTDGYPIVGYTTMEFATCYSNNAVKSEILAFLTQLYGSGNKTNLTFEGFAGLPAAYKTTISTVFVKGTSPYVINIGNTQECGTTVTGIVTRAPGL
jgi:ABC-type phosphate transport system substrate-binding protein